MRTTINLDDHLFSEAKQLAARTGRTFASLMADALRQFLSSRDVGPTASPIELPTAGGGTLMPGVDLDDSASLLDLIENNRDDADHRR